MSVIFWRTPDDPAAPEREEVDPPDYSAWDHEHLVAEASLMWRDRREASLDVLRLVAENEVVTAMNRRLRAQVAALTYPPRKLSLIRRARYGPVWVWLALCRRPDAATVTAITGGLTFYAALRFAVWATIAIGTRLGR